MGREGAWPPTGVQPIFRGVDRGRPRPAEPRILALQRAQPLRSQTSATDDSSAPYRGSIRAFAGLRSQIRDGRCDPIILRRTAETCRRDGGDEILIECGAPCRQGGLDRRVRIAWPASSPATSPSLISPSR